VCWIELFLCAALEEELCAERRCLCEMKRDYEYNLSLLKARDEELAQYETSFSHVKRIINALVAENSELRVSPEKNDFYILSREKTFHPELVRNHNSLSRLRKRRSYILSRLEFSS